jgi:Fe-S cluster assembly protein SufD
MSARRIRLTRGGNVCEEVLLDEVGNRKDLKITFLLKGNAFLDLSVPISHTASGTDSNVSIRGVVDDRARALVKGLVKIAPNIKGVESFLSVKILVVSREAKAEARPELEILANNVKASHAATVGKIDPEQIFYMESRGFSYTEAKRLIIKGWIEDF